MIFFNSNTQSTGHIDTTSKSWYMWQPNVMVLSTVPCDAIRPVALFTNS